MAIYFPDILENNNSEYAALDVTFLKGNSYPIDLIANVGNIPTDKRKIGAIVFASSSQKFYGYTDTSVSGWTTLSNWSTLGSVDSGSFLYSGSFVTSSGVLTLYSADTNYSIDLSSLSTGGATPTLDAVTTAGNTTNNSIEVYDVTGHHGRFSGTVSASLVGVGVHPYNGNLEVKGISYQAGRVLFPELREVTTGLKFLAIQTGSLGGFGELTALDFSHFVSSSNTGSFVYSGSFDGSTTLTLYSTDTNYSLDLSALAGGSTDITALNNFTGSAQTSLDALNLFSGSANTRLADLESATGSLYYSSSIAGSNLKFNQKDGTTETISLAGFTPASATVGESVASDSVFGSDIGNNGFEIWNSAGNTFTTLTINGVDIEAIAPKSVADDSRLLALGTIQLFRATGSNDVTGFEYRLYNSTAASVIDSRVHNFTSYLIGSGIGKLATTFTFSIPLTDTSNITQNDVIQLQVRQLQTGQIYLSGSIDFASLSLVSITN